MRLANQLHSSTFESLNIIQALFIHSPILLFFLSLSIHFLLLLLLLVELSLVSYLLLEMLKIIQNQIFLSSHLMNRFFIIF
jgi:hypothetical protein